MRSLFPLEILLNMDILAFLFLLSMSAFYVDEVLYRDFIFRWIWYVVYGVGVFVCGFGGCDGCELWFLWGGSVDGGGVVDGGDGGDGEMGMGMGREVGKGGREVGREGGREEREGDGGDGGGDCGEVGVMGVMGMGRAIGR